ncbi:MAG: hypothetical protein R3245_07645 [Kiloniellales bacterium]|nr:hypothetical protein [Kiloniellales bacterium]
MELKDLNPNDLLMFGRQRLAEGDRGIAKNALETLVHKAPDYSQAFALLASIAYQEGEDFQAEAYLDRAIDLMRTMSEKRPRDMPTRASFANLLMARGHTDEAVSLLKEVDLPIYPVRATDEEFEAKLSQAREKGVASILINTVPKSASESIWNRLASGLGLAQGHISLCLYPDCTVIPARAGFAANGGLIAKEHLPATPHNLAALSDAGFKRVIFHLRDPRQVLVSWAHFVKDDVSMRLMGPLWRKVVPPATVLGGGLEAILDWCVDGFLPQLIGFVEGWQKAAEDPNQQMDVKFLAFETFLKDEEDYIGEALSFLGIDPQSFDWTARSETVHLRQGEAEEWRDVLTSRQKEKAWSLIPRDLTAQQGWSR